MSLMVHGSPLTPSRPPPHLPLQHVEQVGFGELRGFLAPLPPALDDAGVVGAEQAAEEEDRGAASTAYDPAAAAHLSRPSSRSPAARRGRSLSISRSSRRQSAALGPFGW